MKGSFHGAIKCRIEHITFQTHLGARHWSGEQRRVLEFVSLASFLRVCECQMKLFLQFARALSCVRSSFTLFHVAQSLSLSLLFSPFMIALCAISFGPFQCSEGARSAYRAYLITMFKRKGCDEATRSSYLQNTSTTTHTIKLHWLQTKQTMLCIMKMAKKCKKKGLFPPRPQEISQHLNPENLRRI